MSPPAVRSMYIPANVSPLGEIRRFEIKIVHPRESCRCEEFLFWGGGSTGLRSSDNYTHVTF